MLSFSQIEQKQWLDAKAAGKARFLPRGIVGSLVNGLVILLGLALLNPSHSFRESIVPALVVLPIFLLGGYLTAVWQWQDFEKKYPERSVASLGVDRRILSEIALVLIIHVNRH